MTWQVLINGEEKDLTDDEIQVQIRGGQIKADTPISHLGVEGPAKLFTDLKPYFLSSCENANPSPAVPDQSESRFGRIKQTALSTATQLASNVKAKISQREQVFGDDVEKISTECDLLNDWGPGRFPVQVGQAAVCAILGVGILANATDILRVTRSLMDTDSGPLQVLFRSVFSPEAAGEISRWMDTVPSNQYAGGMFHRLRHGHDLEALIELIQEHNLTGAIEWFNHIALRDFWTPHGIPFLPTGSGSVFEWLVSRGVSKSAAASFLSLNAADVAGAMLIYRASKLLIKYVKEKLRERKARQLWDRAEELEELNDFESADLCYDQALGYAPEEPAPLVWVALRALDRAHKANEQSMLRQHYQRCYQLADAVRIRLAKQDQTVPFSGGTQVSLRGLSVILMTMAWPSVIGEQENKIEGQRGIVAGGINDLLGTAEKLRKGIQIPGIGGTVAGSRPFSAVLNERLALQLLSGSSQLLPVPHTPLTIHTRITDGLLAVVEKTDNRSEYAQTLLDGFKRKYPLSLPLSDIDLVST